MLNRTYLELNCPYGFVIPDHPDDFRNEWFLNTSCAVGCISPVYSEYSWYFQENAIRIVSWVSVFSMLLLIVTNLRESKLPTLLYCVIYFCSILSITCLCSSYYSLNQKFCHDNAIPLSVDDGISFCAVESCIITYSATGILYTW